MFAVKFSKVLKKHRVEYNDAPNLYSFEKFWRFITVLFCYFQKKRKRIQGSFVSRIWFTFSHFLFHLYFFLKENPDLYLSLVDLVYTISPLNEAEVLSAFDFALSSELSEENKLRFSQRKLDFLEDLGSDVTK